MECIFGIVKECNARKLVEEIERKIAGIDEEIGNEFSIRLDLSKIGMEENPGYVRVKGLSGLDTLAAYVFMIELCKICPYRKSAERRWIWVRSDE